MYQLREYQQEAVNNTVKYFQKTREPAVIVLPTGAGKSLVIAELARIANGRVLVLAHVKELVEQNYEKYQIVGDIDGNPIIGFLNEFGDPFEAGKQELLELQENRPDLFSTLQSRLEKILKQMHPLTV